MNAIRSTTSHIPVFMDDLVTPLYYEVTENRVVVGQLACRRLELMKDFESLYSEEMTRTARGLLDISGGNDVPLLISQPHFYSDNLATQKSWVEQFEGLEVGQKQMHSSFIDIHSQTGRAVNSQVKIQYSLKIPPKDNAFQVMNIIGDGSPLIIPVYWLHKDMTLTESGNKFLYSASVSWLFWVQFMLFTSAFVVTSLSTCVGLYLLKRADYMANNPSMRVNEAELRYEQDRLNMKRVKDEQKEQRRLDREKRKELEMKVQGVNAPPNKERASLV